jgi:hypothetical protein
MIQRLNVLACILERISRDLGNEWDNWRVTGKNPEGVVLGMDDAIETWMTDDMEGEAAVLALEAAKVIVMASDGTASYEQALDAVVEVISSEQWEYCLSVTGEGSAAYGSASPTEVEL